MEVQEQIAALVDILTELQKTILTQQTQIDDLRAYVERTAGVVTKNGTIATKNDNTLLQRVQNVETVVKGVLDRESDHTLDRLIPDRGIN